MAAVRAFYGHINNTINEGEQSIAYLDYNDDLSSILRLLTTGTFAAPFAMVAVGLVRPTE